jgi:hypothetical protein
MANLLIAVFILWNSTGVDASFHLKLCSKPSHMKTHGEMERKKNRLHGLHIGSVIRFFVELSCANPCRFTSYTQALHSSKSGVYIP